MVGSKEINFTDALIDLHTQNVASQLPKFNSWTVGKIYQKVGEPKKTPILRVDQQPLGPEAPPYAVQPASFWSISEKKLTKDIKIIGFSDAHSIQKERKALRLPIQYRAPESFFRETVELPADIWAFGCVVFEIFGSNRLFDGFMPRKDTLLRDMIELLGPLPSRWWQKWENRDQYFLNENTPKINVSEFDSEKKQKPLMLRIREMRSGGDQSPGALRSFEPEELLNFQDLLLATLKYLPSERPTAEHISKLGSIQEQIRERFPKSTN